MKVSNTLNTYLQDKGRYVLSGSWMKDSERFAMPGEELGDSEHDGQ